MLPGMEQRVGDAEQRSLKLSMVGYRELRQSCPYSRDKFRRSSIQRLPISFSKVQCRSGKFRADQPEGEFRTRGDGGLAAPGDRPRCSTPISPAQAPSNPRHCLIRLPCITPYITPYITPRITPRITPVIQFPTRQKSDQNPWDRLDAQFGLIW